MTAIGQSELRIRINTETAAFADDPRSECARILREIADLIERGTSFPINVMDANGNTVGAVRLH